MTRPRVYVAGPISLGDQNANVRAGVMAGLALFEAGYAPFIPHLSHLINPTAVAGTSQYEKWLELDFSFIAVCDALLRLPGESAGADREVAFAQSVGVPVFMDMANLTAAIFPKGDPRFHAILGQLGRLHDRKQADYGNTTDPFANVRASGDWGISPWVGAMVRLNDKVKRLQQYARRGTLANEGAEDSMLDIAVYAMIALILYREVTPSPTSTQSDALNLIPASMPSPPKSSPQES